MKTIPVIETDRSGKKDVDSLESGVATLKWLSSLVNAATPGSYAEVDIPFQ
jgi:hypothetical protein